VRGLIAYLGRKLAGLLDQLLDRFLRRQHAHQFALDIDVLHVLRQPRRIAVCEFTNCCDAGGADQADLGLAHSPGPGVRR